MLIDAGEALQGANVASYVRAQHLEATDIIVPDAAVWGGAGADRAAEMLM